MHTRGQNGEKYSGGTWYCDGDLNQAADQLTASHDIIVTNSGRVSFVDKNGRMISIYLTIDPAETEKGKRVLKEHNEKKRREEKERQEKLNQLVASVGIDRAIEILGGDK